MSYAKVGHLGKEQRDMGLIQWLKWQRTPLPYRRHRRHRFNPGSGRCPGGGHGNPPSIVAWRIPWQRSLAGYSPSGRRIGHDWSNWVCTHRDTRSLKLTNSLLFNWGHLLNNEENPWWCSNDLGCGMFSSPFSISFSFIRSPVWFRLEPFNLLLLQPIFNSLHLCTE